MNADVKSEVERRQIARLCHLTPHRNLVHIATGAGLVSTKGLTDTERSAFNQQDLERWDGHPDHISCSIEYPNVWYYRQKAGDDPLFPVWVVVTIDPRHLWEDGTRFCHRNASAARGAYICDGIEGFRGLYEDSVAGTGGTYRRTEAHLYQCPTDNQAEVLVSRFIPIEDMLSIALPTEEQAAFVYAGLKQIGGEPERFTFTVVPELFNAYRLKSSISAGVRPPEPVWTP